MLVVYFKHTTKGKVFKEMVQDLQAELLMGGIHTNVFRPKRRSYAKDKVTDAEMTAVMYVDGREQAEQAALYLRDQREVDSVEVNHGQQPITVDL